jgi:hypothetical protein
MTSGVPTYDGVFAMSLKTAGLEVSTTARCYASLEDPAKNVGSLFSSCYFATRIRCLCFAELLVEWMTDRRMHFVGCRSRYQL